MLNHVQEHRARLHWPAATNAVGALTEPDLIASRRHKSIIAPREIACLPSQPVNHPLETGIFRTMVARRLQFLCSLQARTVRHARHLWTRTEQNRILLL